MQDNEIVKIYIENDELICGKDRFRQFVIRSLQLNASELKIIRRYNNFVDSAASGTKMFGRTDPAISNFDFGKAHASVSIGGKANIDKDSLSVIGGPDFNTNEVTLEIHEIDEGDPEFGRFAWRSRIFLLTHNWEIGNDDQWCISINLPRKAFDELATVIENKNAGALVISMETDLWAKSHSDHSVPSQSVVWYLRPDNEGRTDRPKSASGMITNLYWSNKPMTMPEHTSDNEPTLSALKSAINRPFSDQSNVWNQSRNLEKAIYFVGFALLILAAVEAWH
jgi:hypothetical protein